MGGEYPASVAYRKLADKNRGFTIRGVASPLGAETARPTEKNLGRILCPNLAIVKRYLGTSKCYSTTQKKHSTESLSENSAYGE